MGRVLYTSSALSSCDSKKLMPNKQSTNNTSKDRPFAPFRSPKSDRAGAVVADITEQISSYEEHFKPRKRARRVTDQAIFERTISAVVCDLIHRHLEQSGGKVAVSLSHRVLGKKGRYRSPALGKRLPDYLKYMASPEMGFVKLVKGSRKFIQFGEDSFTYDSQLTTLEAGPRLIKHIEEHELDFEDLSRSDDEEVIILKAPKKGHKDNGELIDYEDTEDTNRYRVQIKEINRWLEEADIDLMQFVGEPNVDTTARQLCRIFNNGSFTEGGRLWGGFWMNLSKMKRRDDLLINGENIIELDYGQMALRLLYGKVGTPIPDGDLYRIPGLEAYRDGVKKVINSALYADKPQSRMPQGTRQHFGNHTSYNQVLSAIRQHHAPIAEHLFCGIGMELQFLESEVTVFLLQSLNEKGITALPLHDGVFIPKSVKDEAIKTMEWSFKQVTGVEGQVKVDYE